MIVATDALQAARDQTAVETRVANLGIQVERLQNLMLQNIGNSPFMGSLLL